MTAEEMKKKVEESFLASPIGRRFVDAGRRLSARGELVSGEPYDSLANKLWGEYISVLEDERGVLLPGMRLAHEQDMSSECPPPRRGFAPERKVEDHGT